MSKQNVEHKSGRANTGSSPLTGSGNRVIRAAKPLHAAMSKAGLIGRVTHTCETCGHQWQSMDRKTEREIITAAKSNKAGPYCQLCMYLEMAYRTATMRGFKTIQDAANWWDEQRTENSENVKRTHEGQ